MPNPYLSIQSEKPCEKHRIQSYTRIIMKLNITVQTIFATKPICSPNNLKQLKIM